MFSNFDIKKCFNYINFFFFNIKIENRKTEKVKNTKSIFVNLNPVNLSFFLILKK